MTNYRALACDLTEVLVKRGPTWPKELFRKTSAAKLALQSMSDRNFRLAPQSHKQWCANALRDCERAWADHGAHEKGC